VIVPDCHDGVDRRGFSEPWAQLAAQRLFPRCCGKALAAPTPKSLPKPQSRVFTTQ